MTWISGYCHDGGDEPLIVGDVILCRFTASTETKSFRKIKFMGKDYCNGDTEIFVLQGDYSYIIDKLSHVYNVNFVEPTLKGLTKNEPIGSLADCSGFTISWQRIGHTDEFDEMDEQRRLNIGAFSPTYYSGLKVKG